MFTKTIIAFFTLLSTAFCYAEVEKLELDIFNYEDVIKNDEATIAKMRKSLLEKGIAGIRGVPGYKEAAAKFIETAKAFSMLDEATKNQYAPNRHAGEFLGYEIGAEKFKRPDGSWVIDDAKASYYFFVPDKAENVWPKEVDLQKDANAITSIMFNVGCDFFRKVDLMKSGCYLPLDKLYGVARMLHYRKQSDVTMNNPYWCGAHFDHGLFTALMPAFYFVNGEQVSEPEEAGLFVRTGDKEFFKVDANDPDVMLFQVGEFGQLATNDDIRATEHRVHKARGGIERYTLAVFFDPPMDTVIHSNSVLAEDSRYGAKPGEGCSFIQWHLSSLKRYLVEDKK